jgi:hypothetical protein
MDEELVSQISAYRRLPIVASRDLGNSADCQPRRSRYDSERSGIHRSQLAGDPRPPAISEESVMYVIREVLHCKPGKVRPMVEKFRVLSNVLEELGQEPLRLLTDVGGEPFWTIVAEAKVERVDDFFTLEQKLMENGTLRNAMADYHDLVDSGRREIYRIES